MKNESYKDMEMTRGRRPGYNRKTTRVGGDNAFRCVKRTKNNRGRERSEEYSRFESEHHDALNTYRYL